MRPPAPEGLQGCILAEINPVLLFLFLVLSCCSAHCESPKLFEECGRGLKKSNNLPKLKMSRFCDPADSFRGNQVLRGRGKTSDEQLQYRRANDVSFIWK